ncbi:UNVERIFIED_CONTAM: hypothetical protein Sradi_2014700 [Sesamum radiatum]|uniref:Uncharacterized protein n=1 Tax=Sesamum radiatum TaxID=300843 RepID=A0AAW2TGH0_SESRA
MQLANDHHKGAARIHLIDAHYKKCRVLRNPSKEADPPNVYTVQDQKAPRLP